ncbi:MAG: phosphocholine cytidylyltransferase family protein [Candidatus Acidiferrales bacterium]
MTQGVRCAVILAAGRGERLRPLTVSRPKALVVVGYQTILGRTLQTIAEQGVSKVILVTGYRGNLIKKYVKNEFPHLRVVFLRNSKYSRTNTLYSLWLTRAQVAGKPFLLIDGDLLFEPRILKAVLKSKVSNVLACDGGRRLDEEAVCVTGDSDGRIRQIGKHLVRKNTVHGESIGLAKFGPHGSRLLFQFGRGVLRGPRGMTAYYEAAFQEILNRGVFLSRVDIRGRRWAEIDNHQDLRRAQVLFKA